MYFNFNFFIGVPMRITSSAIVLKICEIAAVIKTFKSIIKKKKNNHELNKKEFWISMVLIDSVTSHDEFVLINNNFIKHEEVSGLLSSSGIKPSLSKIPLVGPFLF